MQEAVDVPLAWFGPHGDDPVPANDLWHATRLAVERANAAGGYEGRPFRLVPVWSKDPWGSGIASLARTIYRENVRAVIGGVDGPSAHLAEQVVAKARLPLINPASTDETVNMANVPWTFTFMPTDTRQAEALAGEIMSRGASGEALIVSATDHDSRRLASELLGALTQKGPSPRHHLEFDGGEEGAAAVAEEVAALGPSSVVILAGPEASAVFLRALRGEVEDVRAYGGSVLGSRAFREAACPSSNGTIFPRLCDPAAMSPEFVEAFRAAAGAAPDCAAAQAWDAANMLVEAIRRAGPDRAGIRDALADLAGAPGERGEARAEVPHPWTGEAGTVLWNGLGQNLRPVTLAVLGDVESEPGS
jgi:branched-chain amino acid transport system substrate-binding protein